jgi:hypothetical protein
MRPLGGPAVGVRSRAHQEAARVGRVDGERRRVRHGLLIHLLAPFDATPLLNERRHHHRAYVHGDPTRPFLNHPRTGCRRVDGQVGWGESAQICVRPLEVAYAEAVTCMRGCSLNAEIVQQPRRCNQAPADRELTRRDEIRLRVDSRALCVCARLLVAFAGLRPQRRAAVTSDGEGLSIGTLHKVHPFTLLTPYYTPNCLCVSLPREASRVLRDRRTEGAVDADAGNDGEELPAGVGRETGRAHAGHPPPQRRRCICRRRWTL